MRPPMPEPDLAFREEVFHLATKALLRHLLGGYPRVVIERFGVDFAIWIGDPPGVTTKFLEVKVYLGARQGGVGFGDAQGRGCQVDLLLEDDYHLDIIGSNTRWLVGDGTKPAGSARFAIVPPNVARDAAMAGVKKGKQNNFRVSAFANLLLPWPDFCSELQAFLLAPQAPAPKPAA